MNHNMPLFQIPVSLALMVFMLIGCCACVSMPGLALTTPTPIVIFVTATPMLIPTSALPTDTSIPSPIGTSTLPPTNTPAFTPTGTSAPAPTITPTAPPVPPADTPTPTPPPYDFVIVHQRMWTNEENGGVSQNGSVTGCGYGHQIYVWVIDAAGNPLDGVVIGDTYDNPRHISGEKGPGHAQYDLYMNGYRLLVVEDTNAGRPVTSQVSEVMSSNDWEIPIPWLIEAHYCATEQECLERRADPNRPDRGSSLCWGHYSHEITFQRTP